MVPPIGETPVTSENVKELTDAELDIVLNSDEAKAKIAANFTAQEKKEHNYEYLLNKPNMTAKDKEGMQKSIDLLVDKKMDTSENIKMLYDVLYTKEYVKVGPTKRARENLKAKPNGKNILKHGNEIYFRFNALKKKNELLAKKEMEIPSNDRTTASLQALPRNLEQHQSRDISGTILGSILNLSVCGAIGDKNGLQNEDYGLIWTSSEDGELGGLSFNFDERGGCISIHHKLNACPVRPVFK